MTPTLDPATTPRRSTPSPLSAQQSKSKRRRKPSATATTAASSPAVAPSPARGNESNDNSRRRSTTPCEPVLIRAQSPQTLIPCTAAATAAVTAPSTPRPNAVASSTRDSPRLGTALNITPNLLLVDAEAIHDQVPVSLTAQRTVNPIRRIVDRTNVRPNPQLPLISLALGDPTIFGNLTTHPAVIDAVEDQVRNTRSHGYAPSVGIEQARAAIANFHSVPGAPRISSRDVVITSGCSSALDIAIAALCDPGKTLLLPRPAFALYETLATSKGVLVKHYDLLPEQQWEADLVHMESLIDPTTAAILINNPSNPCGSVFSKEHIRAILDLCARHRLPLISDEIYSDIIFRLDQDPFHPAASLAPFNVPILTVGGLAKKWLVPGWRVGWIIIHDTPGCPRLNLVRDGIVSLSQIILGANTMIQYAIPRILALTPKSFYAATRATLRHNASICREVLGNARGLSLIEPRGAMYMMVGIDVSRLEGIADDVDFCEKLLEKQSVACLPGQCFNYPGYFRVVFTAPGDKLQEACRRIAEFMQQHIK